jgi:perosamine synthetase
MAAVPIRIPLSAPQFGAEEEQALLAVLRSGWVSTASPVVRQFEMALAGWLGVKDGVALNSGTAALHIALQLLGIGVGDEVLVPALSFIATVNPVRYVGATPVFADVEPDTLAVSPATLTPLLTEKTKAVIVTHLFGLSAHMPELMAWAEKHNLWVIEDAAEALGSTVNNAAGVSQFAGTFGHIGCFSFNGNKTLTTGSGGFLVSNVFEERLPEARGLSAQSRTLSSEEIEHDGVGHNYRMNALQAALGLSQLPRLQGMVEQRQAIALRYHQVFSEAQEQAGSLYYLNEQQHGQAPSYWLSCLRLNKAKQRQPLIRHARGLGLEFRPIFKPLPLLKPYFQEAKNPDSLWPNALAAWQTGVCLPSSHWLSEAEQAEVNICILNFVQQEVATGH